VVQTQELDDLLLDINSRNALMREFAERMGREYYSKSRSGEFAAAADIWRSFGPLISNECDLFHQKEYWHVFNLRAGGRV
jgi:hypothetical protein